MTDLANPPAAALFPSVVSHVTAIRHDLHQHPELGYEEFYTSALVSKELTRLGIEHKTGLAGGTGILATIRGNADGPCVALRADMDALPVEEATNLPYASTHAGRMHACGHDGHTSILLGAAAILKNLAPSLKGTIKLIFQPAEEGGRGAQRMCNDGVLANPKVDAVFGLHGWPGLKVGTVASRPGPLLASVDGFRITLRGKGTHAAAPQEGVDPIVAGSALVQALQTIVSRENDANDAVVVTIGQFNAGAAFNVIPPTATLAGTLRALTPPVRDRAIEAIQRIARGIAATYRCQCDIAFSDSTPATTNHPEMTEFVRQTAQATLGQDSYVTAPKPAMWGEDFSFYLNEVPGCFYVLGVQPHDRDSYPMLHNPAYDFTDAALPVGIRMMVALATTFLSRP
jgi:amidohydrolase